MNSSHSTSTTYDVSRLKRLVTLRAGTVDTINYPFETGGEERKSLLFKRNVIRLLISISYMSIIISVLTLPPCISYIYDDPSFLHAEALPQMLGFATLATMMGKFILGPPTDAYGGNTIMKIAMGMNIFLLWAGSQTHSAKSFFTPTATVAQNFATS